MRTGIANLPLHWGKTPSWLFEKMKELSFEIARVIVWEFGPEEFLKRLSDPFWFQAFGCVLGFDWHSSGLTTTVCAALKEGIKGREKDVGFFICGGKGKTSLKTPSEIEIQSQKIGKDGKKLVFASKMTAKIDNSAVQDGYTLYHHSFIFTFKGNWAVIQQGMKENGWARRYHWTNLISNFNFLSDPHKGIISSKKEKQVLNLVAKESKNCQEVATKLACQKPQKTTRLLEKIKVLNLEKNHFISVKNLNFAYLEKIFTKTYEFQPKDFKELLQIEGVGAKTLRALSLIAELIYGAPPSFSDPAKFAFAHGGKDGHPFPVDRELYEKSIEILRLALNKAKFSRSEKIHAFYRLTNLLSTYAVEKRGLKCGNLKKKF